MPSILNATTSSGLVTSADNSGSLQLATNNGTTAVTIDTSQNVGIGTTSPVTKLNVEGTLRINRSGQAAQYVNLYSTGGEGFIDAVNSDSVTNQTIVFRSGNNSSTTERMKIDSSGNLLFNSGYGSVATAYGCRAWVNFNGTGTVAIRASGNVSSITDVGTGEYRVNFSTAMPNENYAVVTGTAGNTNRYLRDTYYQISSTSYVNIFAFFSADNATTLMALADSDPITVAIFR
jgi:hypothetical protein